MLETRDLTAYYGDFQVLYGIDTTIAPGETIAIIGANGAGKSSYLKALTGLIRAESGSVRFEDRPIGALSAANLYFAEQAPWGKKDDLARMGAILATTADVLRRAAIAAQPFVPTSAAKVLDLLAVPADQRLLQHALDPDLFGAAGTPLPPPEPVFKKFEQAKAAG